MLKVGGILSGDFEWLLLFWLRLQVGGGESESDMPGPGGASHRRCAAAAAAAASDDESFMIIIMNH